MTQQHAAVDALIARVGVGEMVADVTQRGGTQQGIAQGMDGNVGVAVAQQASLPFNLDAAQPQGSTLDQAVYVKSHSDAEHSHFSVF